MNKRYWKSEAKAARGRAEEAEGKVDTLAWRVRELERELEDKRKNWEPIKIKHPYQPVDPKCQLCDDPPEDPRHG